MSSDCTFRERLLARLSSAGMVPRTEAGHAHYLGSTKDIIASEEVRRWVQNKPNSLYHPVWQFRRTAFSMDTDGTIMRSF